MFGFLKNGKIYKELDEIIAQIDSNVANNYKDAAQEAVGCLEEKINELLQAVNTTNNTKGIILFIIHSN